MTKFLGGIPVGSILVERPRPPRHRCPATKAAEDEIWTEHKRQHAQDYRNFADTWPAEIRSRFGLETT